MFEVSSDAMELIAARLESALEGRPDLRRGTSKIGLRLNFDRSRAFLSLAFPRPSDRVILFMGRPVLILDGSDYSRLEDTRLVVQDGPGGSGLSIERSATNAPIPQAAGVSRAGFLPAVE